MPQIPDSPSPKQADFDATKKITTSKQQLDLLKDLEQNTSKQSRLSGYLALAKGEQSKQVATTKKASSSKTTSSTDSPTTTDSKYEIEYLKKLIALLEKDLGKDPAIAKELAKDKATLNRISKDYPNLTKQDLKDLGDIASQANTLSGKLTDAQKKDFIQIEIEMFQAMTGANKAEITKLEKELSSYGDVVKVEQELAQIQTLLNEMTYGNEPLTQTQLTELLTDVKNLMQQLPNLPKGIQGEIKKALKTLSGLTTTMNGKTFSFGSLIGDLQFKNWIQEYDASTNNPTTAGLEAFLTKKVKEFEGASGKTGLASQVDKELEANLSSLKEQAAKNPKGPFYPADAQGILSSYSSSNFYASVGRAIIGISYEAYNEFGDIIKKVNDFINQSKDTVSGLEKQIKEYQALDDVYSQAITSLQVKKMWSSNLQEAFFEAILNHYMPGQESYLQGLANLLNYSNFGSNMDNGIISDLTGFGNAQYDFNFSSWLQSQSLGKQTVYIKEKVRERVPLGVGPYRTFYKEVPVNETVYKGSISAAQKKISTEEGKVTDDINKANKALGNISADESKIKQEVKDGKLTPAQGQKLIGELNGYKKSLTTAITNLKQLQGALKSIKFNPVYDKNGKLVPNEFTVSGDTGEVSKLENTLVNGTAAEGGLTNISSEISANQKSWSSQSTTNQMQLQLVMTEIQQEWAVVATALSQLNQVVLTFAKGVGGK